MFFLKTNTISVLEVTSNKVILQNFSHQKGETVLVGSTEFDILEKALENISKKSLLFLLLKNQQVLTKEQSINFQLNAKNSDGYVERTFSISTQDFFYHVNQKKEQISASIIRKSYLQELITKAENFNLHIHSCYLGHNSTSSIIDNYFSKEEIVYYGDFKAFQNGLEKQDKSIRSNRVYQMTALGVLCMFILVSAIYYSFQYPKHLTLQQQKNLNLERLNNIKSLTDKIDKQEKLINQINKLSNTNVGNLIDQLLLIKPNAILLDQLDFQPILKKIKTEKDILVKANHIVIKGKSKQHNDLQTWISNLESLSLVRSVEILSFNDLKTTSEFKLAIHLYETKETTTK